MMKAKQLEGIKTRARRYKALDKKTYVTLPVRDFDRLVVAAEKDETPQIGCPKHLQPHEDPCNKSGIGEG